MPTATPLTEAQIAAATADVPASELADALPLPWSDEDAQIANASDVPDSWFEDGERTELAEREQPEPTRRATTTPTRRATARKPAKAPTRPKLADLPHERNVCLCGCGEPTGGPAHRPSRFRAGHDARAKGAAQRIFREQEPRDGDPTLAHAIATWNLRHADLPTETHLPEDATLVDVVEAWNPTWVARFLTPAPERKSRAKAAEGEEEPEAEASES